MYYSKKIQFRFVFYIFPALNRRSVLLHYLIIMYIVLLHGTVDVRLFSAIYISPTTRMHVAEMLPLNTLCSTCNISDMHWPAATRHNKQLGGRLIHHNKMTQVSAVSPSLQVLLFPYARANDCRSNALCFTVPSQLGLYSWPSQHVTWDIRKYAEYNQQQCYVSWDLGAR